MSSVEKAKTTTEEDLNKYFTGKILKDLYPNDVGIYNTFKSFTNQRKIRASKTISVKIKIGLSDYCNVKMVGYRPEKLISELEDYLANSRKYLVGPERAKNLNIILTAAKEFKKKIDKEKEALCQLEKN